MKGPDALQFLLVPDAGAARRVRRLIAEQGACTGVVVGTWPELVEWARRSYLLPAPADDWDAVFGAALGESQGRVLGGELQGGAGGDGGGRGVCARRGAVGDGARR